MDVNRQPIGQGLVYLPDLYKKQPPTTETPPTSSPIPGTTGTTPTATPFLDGLGFQPGSVQAAPSQNVVAISSLPKNSGDAIPPHYETKNGRLYNDKGQLMAAPGVNLTPAFTSLGGNQTDPGKIAAALDEIKAQGGAGVRLNRLSDSNPTEDASDEAFMARARMVVDAARQRGMSVTITYRRPDEYAVGGTLKNGISLMTPDEAQKQTAFWSQAARVFRQDGNVLFGINNETGGGPRGGEAQFQPTPETQGQWLQQQKDTIAAIRAQRAPQPIVIPDWGSGDTRFTRSGGELAAFDREQQAAHGLNPDKDGNIVAGISAYTQGYSQLKSDITKIQQQGPAVVLSELGKVHDIPNSTVDLSLKQPVQAAQELGIPTYFWEKENLKKDDQAAIYFGQWKATQEQWRNNPPPFLTTQPE